jgi:HK97 family phage portal protein
MIMARFNFKDFFSSFVKEKGYLGFISNRLPVRSQNWGPTEFLRAHDVSLYVNRAINKRADKVGEIQFQLKDQKGDVIEQDPILDLLYKPNKVFAGSDKFWALAAKYYDLIGEVYIWIEYGQRQFGDTKKIQGLHLLIPIFMEPKFNGDGEPVKFTYKPQGADAIDYAPEEILYIHNPDPSNPLRGQSILKAGINAIQTEIQISTYHSRVIENGGKVDGILNFKGNNLTKSQLTEIKDAYKKEYSDARKSGTPLFLGGDAEYKRVGLTPDELAFLEAKKMTLEDICILTGVPKSMLASTNDVKFDNADADRAIFLRETINPLLKMFAEALDEKLFPDDKRTLTYVDPTPENIDQKLKETESGVKNYYMTINEARKRHGLDPIDNGDSIMVPFNVMPLAEDKKAITEKSKGFDKRDKAVHPNEDPDIREMWGKMQVKRMDARESKFIDVAKEYFDDQRDRLIDVLQPEKTRIFRKKDLLDESLQLELEVKIGKAKFLPLLTQLLIDAGIDAMEFVGSDYQFILSAEIESWLENKAEIFLRSVNETTFKQLKKQFEESLAEGENRQELIDRIKDTYGNINEVRASMIARTEVHAATQYGTMEGYKQAGLETKIWVTVGDANVRHSHASIDGEEKPFNMAFSNGLMFPGDPNGPAGEVINCRCTI